jgi:hypothetical protein
MAKKHMKKCLPSLATKEMQIKTTLRFYLALLTTGIIKNTNNKGCEEKGTLIHCWCTSYTRMNKYILNLLKSPEED